MATKKKSTKKAVKKEAVEEVKTPEVEEETKEEVKLEPEVEEPKPIGSLRWGKKVYQAVGTVKTVSLRGPISKDRLPSDIQRWLTNKGYGTNVYLKDKEWLERHNVDMKMIEKLKKFINDNYL